MKATEARFQAETNAARIKREEDAQREKDRAARIRQEAARRKKFAAEFSASTDSSIDYAIKNGDTNTEIYVGDRENSHVRAAASYEKHPYKNEMEKVFARLKKEGYAVAKADVDCQKETTQHESSVPDYDYYTYHSFVKISW